MILILTSTATSVSNLASHSITKTLKLYGLSIRERFREKEVEPSTGKKKSTKGPPKKKNKKAKTVQKEEDGQVQSIYVPMGYGGIFFYLVVDSNFKGGITVPKFVWDWIHSNFVSTLSLYLTVRGFLPPDF